MKSSDMKIVAIILSIALFFTIVTSNAVSVASVVMLAKGGNGGSAAPVGTTAPANNNNVAQANNNSATPVGNNGTPADNSSGTTAPANQSGTTAPAGNNSSSGTTAAQNKGGETTPNNNNAATQGQNSPQKSKEEVLAAYTAVMNKAKTDKPGFKKVEYQKLPDDAASRQVSEGGNLVGTLLDLVNKLGIMKDQATAESAPEMHNKGDDTRWFPVYKCQKGCYLTDASKIKEYNYETLANGNVKITFVLVDEQNPEPMAEGASSSTSYTGAVFSPLAKKDIDETLNGGTVSAVVKNVTYSLNYHDCKAILEYNPKTNQAVKLEQYMNVAIQGSGKILGVKQITIDKQELLNTMICSDFKY